ncbi:MAG: VacJ family lipoprotein [Verrucomicrobia bacterium]|nr:VacJ family lipoprotein [Verrucomicrobiota bacterium]
MNKKLITLLVGILPLTAFHKATAAGGSASGSDIVVITKEGVKPVFLEGGRLPKNSTETYFLKSEVEIKGRSVAKPTPNPSPKPKPKPVFSPLAQTTSKSVKADKVTALPQKLQSAPAPSPRNVKAIVKKDVPKRQSAPPQAPSIAKAPPSKPSEPQVPSGNGTANITITKKSPAAGVPKDVLDEYSQVALIPDAIEPLNRGFFWFNHQLYTFVFRPVSKVYGVLPKTARTAVFNVYDNVEFPVRFVNDLLQLKFKNADLELRKFLVNSVAGVGGIMRVSDRIPALAKVPSADTGQTLAKWGIGHGCYIVLPVFGPSSVRDTVGLVGDYALSPVTWVSFGGVPAAAALAVTGPNSVRNLDTRLNTYDAATKNSIDPYQAVRSGYSQYRKKAASQ